MFGDVNINISVTSPVLSSFCKVVNPHNLSFAHTDHTRICDNTATTIDIMLSSTPEHTNTCEVIPPLLQITMEFLQVYGISYHKLTEKYGNTTMQTLSWQITADSIVVDGDINYNVFCANWERC